MKWIFVLLLCSSVAGAESVGSVLDKAAVYSLLLQQKAGEKSKGPLGGSFENGEKMLRANNPENEANIVFNEKGFQVLKVCGFACLAPGLDSKVAVPPDALTIPATSDVLNETNKGYNEAAQEFATRFNKQIYERQNPAAKGQDPIPKALPDSDLTMNGVTIGKSNLYNSIGRFGTNMFHKEGSGGETLWIVCWKGADGTTLAFESGEAGGRDQVILEGRLLASGAEYAHAKYCKDSKKVSAALALAGLHLGDSSADAEKKRGAPSVREDQKAIWRYALDQKKKSILSSVELSFKDDKITEISVGKETTH